MDIEDRKKIQRSMYNPVRWFNKVAGVLVFEIEPSKTWWAHRNLYWPSHVNTGWATTNGPDLGRCSEAVAWCVHELGPSLVKAPPDQQRWTYYQMAYRKGDRRTFVFFFKDHRDAIAFKLRWC